MCENESDDGTCPKQSTFSAIFARTKDTIPEEEKDKLAAAVLSTCVQPGAFIRAVHDRKCYVLCQF